MPAEWWRYFNLVIRMRVSYSPDYYAPIPDQHVFPMRKFEGLYQWIIDQPWMNPSGVISPSMARMDHLELIHTPSYLNAVWDGGLSDKEIRRMGLPWSKGLAIRSRTAVQGTMNAAFMALQDGISGNLAGGTHHAMPEWGEGFCVFNDVAVAVKALRQAQWVRKVLVIDCDVHQGNGTSACLADEPDVFTFSMHGEKNYPFRKVPSTLDVGLEDGTDDEEYLMALEEALEEIQMQFTPDLVFYLAGIDVLESDRFGRLSLTLDGLMERDQRVLRTYAEKQIPVVVLLSGGYAPTLQETVMAHSVVYQAAHDVESLY